MRLARWDPWRDMFDLRRSMERAFSELSPWEAFPEVTAGPAVDLFETDEAVTVEVQLPGVKPDEVELTVSDRTLTVRGERKGHREVEDEAYLRREMSYGTFLRGVTLPATADTDKGEAHFEDGVLTVTFPKVAEAKPRKIALRP